MSDFLPRLKTEITKTKQVDRKGLALLKAVAMMMEQSRGEPDKIMEIADALRHGGNELLELIATPSPDSVLRPTETNRIEPVTTSTVPNTPEPQEPLKPPYVPDPEKTVSKGITTTAAPSTPVPANKPISTQEPEHKRTNDEAKAKLDSKSTPLDHEPKQHK